MVAAPTVGANPSRPDAIRGLYSFNKRLCLEAQRPSARPSVRNLRIGNLPTLSASPEKLDQPGIWPGVIQHDVQDARLPVVAVQTRGMTAPLTSTVSRLRWVLSVTQGSGWIDVAACQRFTVDDHFCSPRRLAIMAM